MLTYNNRIRFSGFIQGTPVIFFHAFPLNQKMWEPQFQFLQTKNISYISFDYPGFGSSSLVSPQMSINDYGIQAYNIFKDLNVKKAIFIGLSMGGYVLLNLFRQYPEIFAGLLLANTRATADSEDSRKNRYKSIQRLEDRADLNFLVEFHHQKFFTEDTRKNSTQMVQRVDKMMRENSIRGIIQALTAMAERPNTEELLKEMNFPVKIVAGAQDPLVGISEAKKMLSCLPNGTINIIPHAAHLTNLEQPEQFNTALWELVSLIQ
jgi:3-oxoadipate enol-lactonase